MSAEGVAGQMYAAGITVCIVGNSLQQVRLKGEGTLTDDDCRRLTRIAQDLNGVAIDLIERSSRIARDHDVVNFPPEGLP